MASRSVSRATRAIIAPFADEPTPEKELQYVYAAVVSALTAMDSAANREAATTELRRRNSLHVLLAAES